MLASKTFKGALAALAVIIIVGIYSVSYIKRVADAYIFGYPLVIMDLTRQAMEDDYGLETLRKNNFNHIQSFPDHTFKNVVRPNNDTLYSIAWLDLATSPLVLSVPATDDRHYVIPLMDAWTNVFASVGKRTTGTQAGNYLITGPDSSINAPEGVTQISSPTNMVWIIGRIQTNGKADVAAVSELQKGFTLTPLSHWQQGQITPSFAENNDTQASETEGNNSENPNDDPYHTLVHMSPDHFFQSLSQLLAAQPATDADRAALDNLASLGVQAGESFDVNSMSIIEKLLTKQAIALTQKTIKEKLTDNDRLDNGWAVQRDAIGNYGTDYTTRAVVAMIGLGALPPAEASYPNTVFDSQLRKLSGEHQYRIHFAANALPPVDAFWSLSMYDEDGFFIENPINRYVIGDRDPLQYNPDGSLDLFIQHTAPTTGTRNWLPAPEGEFALTMRLYSPKESFLNGNWQLPSVERI